jgi:hypothetical protein
MGRARRDELARPLSFACDARNAFRNLLPPPRAHGGCLHCALDPVDRPAVGGAAAGYANGRSSLRLDAGRALHAIEPGDSLGRPPCHRRRHRCPHAPARPCVCASAHHARALAGAQRGPRRVLAPRVDPVARGARTGRDGTRRGAYSASAHDLKRALCGRHIHSRNTVVHGHAVRHETGRAASG